MNNIIIKAILIYILFIFSVASKSIKEIEITAATMEWNKKENVAIAIGEAKAIKGNNILYANKIVVFFNKKRDVESINKLNASGNVKFIREDQIATGDSAIYYVENENILMKGNVTLQKEDSIMLGDELSIDLKTSSSKLTSKKNQKVRVKYNSEKIE